jgi:hypothetical protein
MVPLVLAMDYEAKPWWCPRWFLRFLQVFGNDKSIVRVRNMTLHNLHRKLTKGITFTDYKTKWEWYDLRISVAAPQYIQNLADAIEDYYYKVGKKEDTIKQIKAIEPTFNKIMVLDDYMDYLNKLQNKRVNNEEGD